MMPAFSETVAITGGTGMIGSALTKLLLAKGYRVMIFTRKARPSKDNLIYSEWHPAKNKIDPRAIGEADHIIHLAGANVGDKRWTKKRKKEIVDSRVQGAETIVKALQGVPNKVRTVVSASAIGWYGADTGRAFVESDPHANNFLGNTCAKWEAGVMPVTALGKRLVIVRTGIVLSNEGGAFPEFKKPLKAGVAPILGSGTQKISWIHVDDLCRLYLYAIEQQSMNGVYNGVAPEVVSNRQLMMKLGRRRRRPFLPVYVPAFALKLFLGEMSVEVLKSATVDDSRLRSFGFNFLFPTLDAALGDLI
jgi:uncharacterized protein (TIGR01777 family)